MNTIEVHKRNCSDAKIALSWWGGEEKEERMNESAAHRVAQKDGLRKLPVNW